MYANVLNIPEHVTCRNCGCCCGIIPVNSKELTTIKEYIAEHKPALIKQKNPINCPFLDVDNMCAIYPVRPMICRLMGVARGCNCKCGNSANIDGKKFLKDHDKQDIYILNTIDWNKAG